jgi:hypothetical protein
MIACIFIAVAGGAAAGKKTVQRALKSSLLSLHRGEPDTFHVEELHLHGFLKFFNPSSSPPKVPVDPEILGEPVSLPRSPSPAN